MVAIFELPFDRFETARPILSNPPADWGYIDAGLTGVNPARIFVDDPERPTTALMCRTYEYFVGGALGTSVADFIRDAPAEAEVWANFYGFVAVNPKWNDHLVTLQPDLEVIGRRSFRFDPARIDSVRGAADRVPSGLRLAPLTAELAEMADREMPVIIGTFWSGYDRYARHGFGALVLDGDKPVSVNYANVVGGGEANVGVVTLPDYRRRGLATLCSQACIKMAHERGLIATWDCDTVNVASAQLALSLGFVEHDPFQELALPHRQKPKQSEGLWTSEDAGNGLTRWSRR
jgi:GNAT superfamily N-acetyltransferase